MSSIDDRVVNMQFNNSQFQQGIEQTSASLQDLNKNLQLDNASRGIDNVQVAANGLDLSNIEAGVDNISSKFNVFGAVALSAIQHIVGGALDTGKNIAAALIDPLVQGGAKRALALQQAQFQFRGLGLNIQDTMNAALNAVRGTSFGLDDAATAAAQLGASGIDASHGLETVLRSVAGVAAQTGSSYSQIAQIFETVAGNGRLMGEQLNQLSSYGVNAAAVLAKALGTTQANVRDLVSKGKISFKQFSDAMNGAFGANAAKANETYTGALANMHAALARIGADVASPHYLAFRDIFNALGPLFDVIHASLGPLLADFGELQQASSAKAVNLINAFSPAVGAAISDIGTAILTVKRAISGGFNQIFPSNTANTVKTISEFITRLARALIPTELQVSLLKRSFAGLFAIFDIIGRVVGSVLGTLGQLFGFVAGGTTSFLGITAVIGDFLVKIDDFVKSTDGFRAFFQTIGGILAVPLGIFKAFFGVISDGLQAFEKIDTGGFDHFADDIKVQFSGLIAVGAFFGQFGKDVIAVAQRIGAVAGPALAKIGGYFKPVVDAIHNFMSELAVDPTNALQAGLLGGILLAFNGFFGTIKGLLAGNGIAIVTPFKNVVNGIGLNLKALEANVNAKTLTQIAIAIAILAAAAVALSLVNSAKLVVALVAMKELVAGLLAAFEAFSKIEGPKGIFTTVALVLAIQGIAVAILLLAGAVAILAAIPLVNLIKGIAGLSLIMLVLIQSFKQFTKLGPELIFSAAAIAIIAPAIAILAAAIAILGAIPFLNLVQGIGAFALILGIFIGSLALMDKLIDPVALIASAAAIAIIAPALLILSGAVIALGAIPFLNIVQGVLGLAAVMIILTGAILLLGLAGPEALLGAVAIGGVALALVPLIGAIALLGALPIANVVQGIVALAAVMVILVGAVLLLGFTGPVALLGAAALVALAFAISVLAPALVLLSAISWEGIGRLLTVLSAGLGILVVMGILLIPASVGFLLLGTALLLIGTGIGLAATGIGLLATGIGLLVLAGSGGILLLTEAIKVFIGFLPQLGVAFGLALVNMVVSIASGATTLVNAFVKLLTAMLNAIDQVVPLIIAVGTKIIILLINALVKLIPKIVEAGFKIIQAFLNSVAAHIGDIVKTAIKIVTNFIDAVAKKLPSVIKSAGNLVLSFINGLTSYIKDNTSKFTKAGLALFNAIVDGIAAAIKAGGQAIRAAGEKIGNALIAGAKAALGIASPSKVFRYFIMGNVFAGLLQGRDDGIKHATGVGDSVGTALTSSAVDAVKKSVSGISDALNENIDSSPTIRPVLDLTDIQNRAGLISGLLPKQSISVEATHDAATSVALQEAERNLELSKTQPVDPKTGQTVNFTQNNTSPKALSTSELYRQTKNQLSILKGDIGVVNQSGSPQ